MTELFILISFTIAAILIGILMYLHDTRGDA